VASYDLSRQARLDLQDIYLFGVQRFGVAQADRYLMQIYDLLDEIAASPLRFPRDDIREGYRRAVFRSHAIYFRISSEEIVEIIAILGQQDREGWI